jgi:hypothetical protein
MMEEWQAATPCPEGRIDAEDDAIGIFTMHSAKGLEWPVVIPINTATLLRSRQQFVHRASDEALHWLLGDVISPDLDMALPVGRGKSRSRTRAALVRGVHTGQGTTDRPGNSSRWAEILGPNRRPRPPRSSGARPFRVQLRAAPVGRQSTKPADR